MKIILIGYMGSGKSAVGEKLASILDMPFLDLDTEIEKETNRTITELFKTKGQIFFRKKESELLRTLVTSEFNFVLAMGGGTPCYGNTMDLIKTATDCLSIYLKPSLNTLRDRLYMERSERPLIAHLATPEDLNDFIRKHLFERAFYYRQADLTIDADEPIEKVVSSIVLQLF